jgi:hypothetical protein
MIIVVMNIRTGLENRFGEEVWRRAFQYTKINRTIIIIVKIKTTVIIILIVTRGEYIIYFDHSNFIIFEYISLSIHKLLQ